MDSDEALEDVRWARQATRAKSASRPSVPLPVVARLRPVQRKVLRMGLLEGLTHSEIAAATGMPLGTVKTQMRRGLIQVRQWMKLDKPATMGEATRLKGLMTLLLPQPRPRASRCRRRCGSGSTNPPTTG